MHNPEEAAKDLAEKLASRNRHVMLLFGAGASCAAGLPDLNQLKIDVQNTLSDDDKKKYIAIGATRNIEEILSRLRLIAEVLGGTTEALDSLTGDAAQALDKTICAGIANVIQSKATNLEAHLRFARWCARSNYIRPLEIFTINYDNLIEHGLEQVGVPYFDGFVGNYEGLFRPDLVDSTDGRDEITPPSGWVRIWKLHGSISWSRINRGSASVIVRSPAPKDPLAVYPSLQKYEESRRIPFVVLGDRLRRALAVPETTCLVVGYSFGDQHINDLIYDAATFYSSSEVVVLCFGTIPTALAERAKSLPNLTVCSPSCAIIGAKQADWQTRPDETPFWKGDAFTLGAFGGLTEFLLINSRAGSGLILAGGMP
jgi:SIR2-like protein